jgi:hypothetical protein
MTPALSFVSDQVAATLADHSPYGRTVALPDADESTRSAVVW